jgi:O-antigen ligase
MTPQRRSAVLRSAIALDLIVIATGAALLLPSSSAILVTCFAAAVILGAYLGDREGGAAATAGALIILGFFFDDVLHLHDYAFFLATAIASTIGIPHLHRVPAIPMPEPPAAEGVPPPRWLAMLALPLVVAVLYSNVSDILIDNYEVPSILQLCIVGCAVLIWFYRHALEPSRVLLQPMTIAFALYGVVVFLSTIWADDLALADHDVVRVVKNLLITIVCATIAATAPALRRAMAAAVLVAAMLSAVSIAQIATGRTFNELGGLAALSHGNIYEDSADARAAGPLGDANFYGQILVMMLPLAAYLAWSARGWLSKAIWIASGLAITGGVLVTYSRGAMLALAVMVAMSLVALRVPLTRVAIATAVAVIVLLLLPGIVGRRLMTVEALFPQQAPYTEIDSSFEKRKLLTATAARMFDTHPLLGVGAGNYTTFFPQYSNEIGSAFENFNPAGSVEHAHSLYLEIGAETGLLGLIAFLALIATAFAQLWIARRKLRTRDGAMITLAVALSLAAYLVTSLLLHGTSQRYFCLVLAFAGALTRLAADQRRLAA